MIISSEEVQVYRGQLAAYSQALASLDALEVCEGDLEDAATSLAIKIGQQPDRIDWLDGLAKRYRVSICQSQWREDLLNNNITRLVSYLIEERICPPVLATLIVIYVVKQGVSDFCEPLTYLVK